MKKLSYYQATEEASDKNGKIWCMHVSGTREQNFKTKFKTIEEVKDAINCTYKARQRKDTIRTYKDGTKEYLSHNDIYDIRYIIEKYYEEIEEIEVIEHPRTFNEDKKVEQEETSI